MPGAWLTAEQREAIAADLRAGGMTQVDIARKHGTTPQTVHRYAKGLGIARTYRTQPKAKRSRPKCSICGKRTSRRGAICCACVRAGADTPLTGGERVLDPVTRVLRYRAA